MWLDLLCLFKNKESYLNRRRIIHSHHTIAVDTSFSLYHGRSMVVQLSHLMVMDPTVTTAVPCGVHAAVLIAIVAHKLIFTYRVQHKVSCVYTLKLSQNLKYPQYLKWFLKLILELDCSLLFKVLFFEVFY